MLVMLAIPRARDRTLLVADCGRLILLAILGAPTRGSFCKGSINVRVATAENFPRIVSTADGHRGEVSYVAILSEDIILK